MKTEVRLVAYNLGQGGSRDKGVWARVLPPLAPDLLFVQESRVPTHSWLPALMDAPDEHPERWLWTVVPSGRWGSGLWVREGSLTPVPVPEVYTGRVVAAVVEGCVWPGIGAAPVVAMSIHAPTRKGSTYIKEVGRILDFARDPAEGRPMILAGDFNVAVGMRELGQPIGVSPGERALLQRISEEFDMVPCWQTAHPGEQLARTLRWMRRTDSLPYHCDGLFIPRDWAPALQSCAVLEEGEWLALSDHNPVIATLTVPSP